MDARFGGKSQPARRGEKGRGLSSCRLKGRRRSLWCWAQLLLLFVVVFCCVPRAQFSIPQRSQSSGGGSIFCRLTQSLPSRRQITAITLTQQLVVSAAFSLAALILAEDKKLLLFFYLQHKSERSLKNVYHSQILYVIHQCGNFDSQFLKNMF
jgi:hypothetical protein